MYNNHNIQIERGKIMFGFGGDNRRGMRFGFRRANAPCGWNLALDRDADVEKLKRFKDRLEFRKKEVETEIAAVEKRIQELQKL